MDFNQLILDVLFVVLTAVVPILLKYVVNYIKAKIGESNIIEELTKDEKVSKVIEDALQDIMDAVLYVNQTYTESLKEAGKFDEEAQKEAFRLAYEKAVQLISAEAKELIESLYGSFDEWLTLKIEASVNKAKKDSSSSNQPAEA